MGKKAVGKVWMRLGDNDDYHSFDNMFDAGTELGTYLESREFQMKDLGSLSNGTGICAPGFEGHNYISLFWGDDDAQITKRHSQADLADFKRGVREGADKPVWRAKHITPGIISRKANAKHRSNTKHSIIPSGLGGMR